MRLLLPTLLVLFTGAVAAASVQPTIDFSPVPATLWWTLGRIALMAGFLFACVAAFKIPGTGVPELFALVLLGALLAPSVLRGDAAWYEILLIASGLAFLGIELFVIPGFGATGVIGILMLTLGFLLVFLPATSPTHSVSLIDLRNALAILVGGGFLGIVSFAWMSHHFPAATGNSRLVLRETNAARMPDHLWPAVGDVGLAITDLKPGGIVQLPDPTQSLRRVDVVSRRGFIPAGSRIVVTDVVGQVISVRAEADASTERA